MDEVIIDNERVQLREVSKCQLIIPCTVASLMCGFGVNIKFIAFFVKATLFNIIKDLITY